MTINIWTFIILAILIAISAFCIVFSFDKSKSKQFKLILLIIGLIGLGSSLYIFYLMIKYPFN